MKPGDRVVITADALAAETGMDLGFMIGRRGTVIDFNVWLTAPFSGVVPRLMSNVRVRVDGDTADERVFDTGDLRPLSVIEMIGDLG